jgi:S1-C subfamily serine protease
MRTAILLAGLTGLFTGVGYLIGGPRATATIYSVSPFWNGEPIRHVRSLLRALGPDSVGQTVTLGLRRGGETKDIQLTIGARPPT